MKPNKLELIRKCLEREKDQLLTNINKVTIARDESPLPTESRSDTSRIQADNLLQELKIKLNKLDDLIHNLPQRISKEDQVSGLFSYHEILKDGNSFKIIVVPDGCGGREIEGIKLVSVSTTLANSVLNN